MSIAIKDHMCKPGDFRINKNTRIEYRYKEKLWKEAMFMNKKLIKNFITNPNTNLPFDIFDNCGWTDLPKWKTPYPTQPNKNKKWIDFTKELQLKHEKMQCDIFSLGDNVILT